jgi:hypothetical protein
VTWLGVPVLDWLILAFALGLGVEAWLTTRPTPEEREAARREAAETQAQAPPPAEGRTGAIAARDRREDADHPSN